jgi:predicted anti-sigma-YlaC factor YlaD
VKISCGIARDLLPLYLDGICGSESQAAVEEHLLECGSCRGELKAMKEDFLVNNCDSNMTEAEAVQELSKKWKSSIRKYVIRGILITIAVLAVLCIFFEFAFLTQG